MEKIELRVEQRDGRPVDDPRTVTFGVAGGTIGRGGQNKLVLQDLDGAVARVHAMVRLESDSAHIANLCERRPMYVDGLEVRSGEEVALRAGVEVRIGPYSLRVLGQGFEAGAGRPAMPAAAVAPIDVRPVPAQSVSPQSPAVLTSSLLDTPNPWSDIPQQSGGEVYKLGLPGSPELGVWGSSALPIAPIPFSVPAEAGGAQDNPFAMLGRVTPANPAQVAAPVSQVETAAQPAPAQSAPAGPQTIFGVPVGAPAAPAVEPSRNGNVFDVLASPVPAKKSVVERALAIPEDFDPFARDPEKDAQANDPWTGGLPTKTLAEVAKLRHDELLQALPTSPRFPEGLDNSAHTGLPKTLDPRPQLDPLLLFGAGDTPDALLDSGAAVARGSELVQVFSMPRGANSPVQEAAAVVPAAVDALAGLRPTQGLDVPLFGDLDKIDTSGDWLTPAAMPAAASTAASPGTQTPSPLADAQATAAEVCDVQPAATRESIDEPAVQAAVSSAMNDGLSAPASVSLPLERRALPDPAAFDRPDLQALVHAFLEGAGVAAQRSEPNLTPEFMRMFGEAFRVAVQGTIDLLAARSEIKKEFRADVTIIASGANNPLKFLPTADGVVMQMTGQNFPGFMQPVPAMKEAYHDLKVHQLALMAGIRAAYSEALTRFDPAELEKRNASSGGLLSKVSATSRKAALWDSYSQSYKALRRDAEDDLMAFSGKTFVDAYEAAAQSARGGAS